MLRVVEFFVVHPVFCIAYGAMARLMEGYTPPPSSGNREAVITQLFKLCANKYVSRKSFASMLSRARTTPWIAETECNSKYGLAAGSDIHLSILRLLICPSCCAILRSPTVLFCGHTFCRDCVDYNFTCHLCPTVQKSIKLRPCVLISRITSLLWPFIIEEYAELDRAGEYINRGLYEKAISKYNEIIGKVPSSHTSILLRAEAQLANGFTAFALQDAELAIELLPNWPKVSRKSVTSSHSIPALLGSCFNLLESLKS
ncbi:unnamed protein product [Protopolystoma xenopodis]|uniref:RING-type domain-containing protein n=1 Tax=Protopolystoma xenopodis TaxID=117903 RepID=A0A448XRB3_9PLAT|nr:unnamed protein product [Protopolystoma xenopodis]